MHKVTKLTKAAKPHVPGETEIFLLQLKGPQIGARIFLAEGETTVGRSEACKVVVDAESVSRSHCSLFVAGHEVRLLDLGSTNGTWVNGRRLQPAEPTLLKVGDRIELGEIVYKLLRQGDVEAAYLEELRRLAITDGLTGAYNRRHLIEYLEKEVARARRHQRPLSLLLFDVDHFKKINDTHGHLAGDRVLEEIGARLRARFLRRGEFFARFGGEEFVVVLPETEAEEGRKAAERLRSTIANEAFRLGGKSIQVTVSVGVASLGPQASTSHGLLAIADENLYRAKREGRDRVGH